VHINKQSDKEVQSEFRGVLLSELRTLNYDQLALLTFHQLERSDSLMAIHTSIQSDGRISLVILNSSIPCSSLDSQQTASDQLVP
jgi:hypothetical protein